MSDQQENQELEQVECPTCGGLSQLRETCEQCDQTGVIMRPIRPGHETLSRIRSRMGKNDGDRYGSNPMSPRTGPKHHDPLWVGTEAP